MKGSQLLRAEGLCKSFRRRRVVDEVSFHVAAGEIVGLLGPNGAGKTTTFRMAIGMLRPDAGRVLLGGRDVTRAPMYRRARLGVGYLAQEPSVFRRLTARGNILAVLELRGIRARERRGRADRLLREFGLDALTDRVAETLSGGEARRLEIARALATEPRLLLLDEPFSGIDPITVEEIQGILVRLRRRGIGVLLTDHNVRDTLRITDRAYILHEGRILREGTPQVLVEDGAVRRVYLGERFAFEGRGLTREEEAGLAGASRGGREEGPEP